MTCRNLLLCLSLAVVATPAWAEWAKLSESPQATFYFENDTIGRNGNFRTVWALTDLKQRNKGGEMSRRVKYEFDCLAGRVRFLSGSSHAEPMGKGNTLYAKNDAENWDNVRVGSPVQQIFRFACAQ